MNNTLHPILYHNIDDSSGNLKNKIEEVCEICGILCKNIKKNILFQSINRSFGYILSSQEFNENESFASKSDLFNQRQNGLASILIVLNSKNSVNNTFNFQIKEFDNNSNKFTLHVGKKYFQVTKQLGGSKFRIKNIQRGCYIDFEKKNYIKKYVWIEDNEKNIMPIMIKDERYNNFYTTIPEIQLNIDELSYEKITTYIILLFYMYNTFGVKCFRRKYNHANLIIDDPWFIEPYGNLSYVNLLKEMKKKHFHTTIAFVPWNCNRNRKKVLNLIKQNSNYYSVAVHGNNHDHYEFTDYDKVPLERQKKSIIQAVKRMEHFRTRTGIEYDKVMVFPHGICPKDTLLVLKKLNFLCTVNYHTTPLNENIKKNYQYLYPAALNFYSFPLLKRVPPDRSKEAILLDLFFGKPLIFYVHQDYFSRGIDSFNETAEFVNKYSQNSVSWTRLSNIIENLFWERIIGQGNHEIVLFSRKIMLENTEDEKITYRIDADKFLSEEVKEIIIKNQNYNGRYGLRDEIELYPGEKIYIDIHYNNNYNIGSVKIDDCDPRITFLRIISDFRDLCLSRFRLGRKIISVYYKKKENST